MRQRFTAVFRWLGYLILEVAVLCVVPAGMGAEPLVPIDEVSGDMHKWEGKRPLVTIWLTISEPRGRYILSSKGAEGADQREVLKEASVRYGLPILLPDNTPPPEPPSTTALSPAEKSFAPLLRRNVDILTATERDPSLLEADGILTGTLASDGNGHWNAQWFLVGKGVEGAWWQEGVSFDVALKYAIERTVGAYAKSGSRKTQQKREK